VIFSAALVAFGHYFAFFALTAALVLQIVLLTASPTIQIAKRIQRADRAYALMALLVLVMGLLRVFYFEKGADYYFGNSYFIIKLSLFVLVGLISAYPTITYLGWNKAIKMGNAPELSIESALNLRRALHYQLVGILGILFCASMMAHGIG
jgi:putative membrane protein